MVEMCGDGAEKTNTITTNNNIDNNGNGYGNSLPDLISEKPDIESKFSVQNLVDMFKKLNPSAKEFFPSNYHKKIDTQLLGIDKNCSGKDGNFPTRRRNAYNQARRRQNGKIRAQREDSVWRTVYVSDIAHQVTEEQLAALFSRCGNVIDCRICGDPHSVLCFGFVEFADEQGAVAALTLVGTVLGYYPLQVLPSKTSILPVNPTYLPRSEDEREMCSRTVYCTNVDQKISQAEVKNFFETTCGKVTRLRLLGDHVHSTRIAFVEFALAESAIMALNCSRMLLGAQSIRVSPSKTRVRSRVSRPTD